MGVEGRKKLEQGFNGLVEALAAHDYAKLSQILEKKLFSTVETRLKGIEALGYHLQLLNSAHFPVKLHNFELHMGVHIQRSLNFRSEDYEQIFSIDEIRATLSGDYLNKLIRPKNDGERLSLEEDDLGKAWVYLSQKAPVKIVCAVCGEFTGGKVLTMGKQGNDVVYHKEDNDDEVHVLRYECIGADLKGEQNIVSGGILSLLPTILNSDLDLQSADWLITDIDDIMHGNPIVEPNSS